MEIPLSSHKLAIVYGNPGKRTKKKTCPVITLRNFPKHTLTEKEMAWL